MLVFFWRLITPDMAARQYYVNGDFTWKEQATDSVTARSWAAGLLPLWDPYSYAGQPLAADSGAAVFYPMDLAFDMTAGAGGVTLLRLEGRVVLDFMLAAALPFGFALADPQRALAAMFLVFGLASQAVASLSLALVAARAGRRLTSVGVTDKSAVHVAMLIACFLPDWFSIIAYVLGVVCFISIGVRLAAVRIYTS